MFKLALICLLFVSANAWGPYYIVGNQSHRVLDVQGNSIQHRTQLIIYDANGGRNQQWCINPDTANNGTDFTVELCNHSQNLGAEYDAGNWYSSAGWWAKLMNRSTSNTQTFVISANGQIRNKDGNCLDVQGGYTGNSTNVIWYGCHSDANQRWTVRARNSDGSIGGLINLHNELSHAHTSL
jgi:hypothetical protein